MDPNFYETDHDGKRTFEHMRDAIKRATCLSAEGKIARVVKHEKVLIQAYLDCSPID